MMKRGICLLLVFAMSASASGGRTACRMTNDQTLARIRSLVEWTREEMEEMDTAHLDDGVQDTDSCAPEGDQLREFPSPQDAGVEREMLRLCATMAAGVYKTVRKQEFERILKENPEIARKFPDLSVRFFQTGVTLGGFDSNRRASLNAPTLAGVIVGETLILAYRGTVTLADMVADLRLASVQPWEDYPGLQVQAAYYGLVKNSYFGKQNSHQKDILNYIDGSYSKTPNETALDGTPIRRIVVCGHSLGGGLAQVTHLCLTTPGSNVFGNLVDALRRREVQVKSVAFAAPMTTALVDPSPKVKEFLRDQIRPHMCNFCFKTDPVPRGYANVEFLLDLLDDVKKKFLLAKTEEDNTMIEKLLRFLKDGLLPWAAHFLGGKAEAALEQARRYRHVGQVIHYRREHARPQIYQDNDDNEEDERGTAAAFCGLAYAPSRGDPLRDALYCHSYLVAEQGLGYWSRSAMPAVP